VAGSYRILSRTGKPVTPRPQAALHDLAAELEGGMVHVWTVLGADLKDASWSARAHLMSADEQARCARYKFERDQTLCRVARLLTRTLVGGYTRRDPASLRFTLSTHKRPSADASIDFNLSHTHGLLAVALSARGPVGIDVEQLSRDLDIPTLSPTVYSSRELEWLHDGDAAGLRDRFFTLWTLKEAYLKAIGVGMSADLTAVSIVPRDERTAYGPPGLAFRHQPLGDDHRLALATRDFVPTGVRFFSAPAELP
jgi:4'-phosphopantetheinyl transferase